MFVPSHSLPLPEFPASASASKTALSPPCSAVELAAPSSRTIVLTPHDLHGAKRVEPQRICPRHKGRTDLRLRRSRSFLPCPERVERQRIRPQRDWRAGLRPQRDRSLHLRRGLGQCLRRGLRRGFVNGAADEAQRGGLPPTSAAPATSATPPAPAAPASACARAYDGGWGVWGREGVAGWERHA